MDATDLRFIPSTFATATSFFTLLYVDREKQEKVFSEVRRVLRDGGRFLIWDVRIPDEAEGKPFFLVQLEVSLPDEAVTTGYGVKKSFQDMDRFKDLAARTGFEVGDEWSRDDLFHLELVKTS
jgi:ubiquinone/menaquinone biosynthesis C-methylase UbiE